MNVDLKRMAPQLCRRGVFEVTRPSANSEYPGHSISGLYWALQSPLTFRILDDVERAVDNWIVRRDGKDISVPDVATLQRWASAGYLKQSDLVFRPITQQWLAPEEVPEIGERRKTATEDVGNSKIRVQGDLVIRQGDQEYNAPNLETLQAWVRDGRIRPESTVFHNELQRWFFVRTFPGIDLPLSFVSAPARVLAVARNYRSLVVWVGIQILFSIWFALADSLQILVGPLLLATVVALAYYAHETAKALGSSSPLLWAAGMLVPCINLFTLWALSTRASEICRANAIRVGFFGPEL